jgi:GNAT superfamily N-acetyltransferase
MTEFGDEIPWLAPLKPIAHATNPTYFREQLLRRLGCGASDEIDAFQLVTSHRSHEFVGGVLHFTHSPERFETDENRRIMNRLVSDGHSYLSCVQVRDAHRGQGHGRDLFRRALGTVLDKYDKAWAVVSDREMLRWYLSLGLGTRLHTSRDNAERLWIISWG